MNDDIDKAAQDDPEWVVWSSREHIEGAVTDLFLEHLSRVPTDWEQHSGKVVGAMPVGVDRFSREMMDWITDVFFYFFPDDDAPIEPGNAELVDRFVAYIGEYFVQNCGGQWFNDPAAKLLYSFGPSIWYDWTDDSDYPVNLLFDSVDDGFSSVTSEWYSRTVDYAEAHGLEHEGLELRRKHGLA